MDQVWMIAALWSLVGLAAMVIARWVGGSLRDEIVRVRTQIERRSKTLRLIRVEGGTLRGGRACPESGPDFSPCVSAPRWIESPLRGHRPRWLALRNSRFDGDSLISGGTAIRAIRTPPGGMEALPRSPRRPPPRRGSAVWASTARQEVQHHCNATLAGRQENPEAGAAASLLLISP